MLRNIISILNIVYSPDTAGNWHKILEFDVLRYSLLKLLQQKLLQQKHIHNIIIIMLLCTNMQGRDVLNVTLHGQPTYIA